MEELLGSNDGRQGPPQFRLRVGKLRELLANVPAEAVVMVVHGDCYCEVPEESIRVVRLPHTGASFVELRAMACKQSGKAPMPKPNTTSIFGEDTE